MSKLCGDCPTTDNYLRFDVLVSRVNLCQYVSGFLKSIFTGRKQFTLTVWYGSAPTYVVNGVQIFPKPESDGTAEAQLTKGDMK